MADTVTTNYGWVKPEVGSSLDTWGAKQNANLDGIDAQVKANANAVAALIVIPVGAVLDYFGAALPAGFLWCDGASYNKSAFPTLGEMLNPGAATTFVTPNYRDRFSVGAGNAYPLLQYGGEAVHVLTSTEMPVHNHPASQDAHSHYVYQDAHSHSDSGHVHGASASQDPHSHGGVLTGTSPTGGSFAPAAGAINVLSGRTDTQAPPVHIAIATDYARLGNAQPAVHADTQQPNVYTANAGSGGAHNNIPPYVACNKIIRAA